MRHSEALEFAMAIVEACLRELVKVGKQNEAWSEQISKHLSYLGKMFMLEAPLMHEAVRCFGIKIASTKPTGDPGWMLRGCSDLAIEAVRGLMKHYSRVFEVEDSAREVVRMFFVVLRFCLEEAFRRHLMVYH